MTATSTGSITSTDSRPSRTPVLALAGVAASAVLSAIGTFGDITGNDHETGSHVGPYLASVGIAVVAAALVFGLVVRGAEQGTSWRRSLILGVLALATCVVFWTGLPPVLAAGAIATALIDRDVVGRFTGGSKAGLVLAAVALAGAIVLAIVG
jgi:hypothetical protein